MLQIALADLRRLSEAAETSYPEEACALLVGRIGLGDQRRVTRLELSRNLAGDRQRRFEIDPGLRIGLERELRGGDERLIGVWHSHPDGPAAPSATDLAMVYEPDLIWLITAVAAGQAVLTLAYLPRQDGSGFRPLEILAAVPQH